MVTLLLLIAGLIVSGIGVGVYLMVRPDPDPSPEVDAPPVTSGRPGTTTPGTTTAPDPGEGTGSGSTAVETPEESDLRSVAADYVDAVNARDEAAATELTCQGTGPGTLFPVGEGREVTLTGVEVIEGPVASATVRVGDGETALLLENQEDGWCVAI